MTDKLREDRLLEIFEKICSHCPYLYEASISSYPWFTQAKKQIVALIKKPQVTEEWIEKKMGELRDLIIYFIKNYQEMSRDEGRGKLKGFIRSLVEEIKKK